jgi:hypothetical protein
MSTAVFAEIEVENIEFTAESIIAVEDVGLHNIATDIVKYLKYILAFLIVIFATSEAKYNG